MIIRKITPEELKRTNELFAIAFEFETDNTKSPLEVYEEASLHPKTRDDFYWQERWAAFEDDGKTMMSFFVAKPFPMHFDGHRVTMTGIGGVASLPQYRRRGGIRGCFEAALPAMYADGAVFSYLYPFSTSYYRKFGYELCCETACYHIRLSSLKPFPVEGTCTLAEQGHLPSAQIRQIYQAWQDKYNMMIVGEDYEYAWIAACNPPKDQTFTYVYESPDRTPKGFMTFRQCSDATGRHIRCSRFFFTDPEGLKGLLNLAAALGSDHQNLILELPTDIDITMLLPEWSMGAVRCEHHKHGMARVINARQALLLARYLGEGALTIALTDPYIPQNNTTLKVTFKDNKALQVTETTAPPDISLKISDFSRLITGACSTEAIPYMEGIKTTAPLTHLQKVFYKKPTHITDHF